MRVTPAGRSEYFEGNQIGRYGRCGRDLLFVWYHSGLHSFDEPAWAMSTDVEWKVSVSVDKLLVVDQEQDSGLYLIDREGFTQRAESFDGSDQYIARASDDYVEKVGDDPTAHLYGNLWIETGNSHGGYHKDRGEA